MSMTWKPRSSLINELVLKRLTRDTKFVYLSTHVFKFPINTIIAWIINDYHEQGNIIITLLLSPLGHISNTGLGPFFGFFPATGLPCAATPLPSFLKFFLPLPFLNLVVLFTINT